MMTPALRRFLKYALVGGSTLGLDLLILAALVQLGHVPYYVATPIGFLIGVSANYAISRPFVFRGTTRRYHHGYGYFIALAGGGALCITAAVAALVTYAHLPYLAARLLVAVFVGMANYLLNLYFNFRVVGHHP